ncbi:MAG: FAD-binding oxidoreductase [bacterium]
MDKEKIYRTLCEICGSENVFTDDDTIEKYSTDMTEHEPRRPDFVVKPVSTEEIVRIVQLANEVRMPLVPAVARTNLGGLTIPTAGGAVIDLNRMNHILEVNETEMYAIIEPGVTFGIISEYLEKNHPDLIIGYPLAPPWSSVACNCLLDGLGNLSNRHGAMSEWINGLEVVLPTGEVMRCGSCAVSKVWFARAPVPDLTGLFISWQGTTGIITRMAVQLWPKPARRKRMFCLSYDIDTTYTLVRRFARSGYFDDIGALSWPTGKMLLGVQYPATERDPDEPEFYLYLDFSGASDEEINLKSKYVKESLKDVRAKSGEIEDPLDINMLLKVNPSFARFAEFPTTLDFLLDHPGGGLTWVGTYGPTAAWEEGVRSGFAILKGNGFTPIVVTRPMRGGHFAVLRFIIIFNKKDNSEVARVKTSLRAIAAMALRLGFVPYKAPAWAVELMKAQMDANYFRTLQAIKNLLDPNHIMNPGKYLL